MPIWPGRLSAFLKSGRAKDFAMLDGLSVFGRVASFIVFTG